MGERLGEILPISASEAVLCTPSCHIDGVHWTSSASAGHCCLFESLGTPSNTASSLRCWAAFILFNPVCAVPPAWVHCSIIPEGTPFPHTWQELPAGAESSCALPSPLANAQVPGQVPFLGSHLFPWRGCSTQHCSSWVTRGSPPWQLKPLHISAHWG